MTGRDHGMVEITCPDCFGAGERVETVIVYNHQTKSDEFIDRAVPCPRTVWVQR